MTNENTEKLTSDKISAIDAAIAKATERKAKKAADPANVAVAEKPAKVAREKVAKVGPTDVEREAKKAEILADRAKRKVEKAVVREAKLAEKMAGKKPAHMSKVLKAAEKLPTLSEAGQRFLNEVTANLSRADVAGLAFHLQHFNRVQATERALSTKLEAGDAVTIVGGDPRFIGKSGIVEKAQRIRCYVNLEGHTKPCYLFTSDVEKVAAVAEVETSTGTDG